jgi:putative ABC transport system permease protein
MKYLPLIWAGLWRRPLRTVLTMLSIFVAFSLFGVLQGINNAFHLAGSRENIDRLVVQSRISYTELLPVSALDQIRKVPGVAAVAHQTWFGAYFRQPQNFVLAFPVVPEDFFKVYDDLGVTPENLQALERTRTGALIGKDVAAKYGWKIGNHISLHSNIWTRAGSGANWEFDIVGVFEDKKSSQGNNDFFFNYDYFDRSRAASAGRVSWYVVKVGDPAQSNLVASRIDALFANSPDETKTVSEKENAQMLLRQLGNVGYFVTAIVGAVFFTLIFVTGNTVSQSIRERRSELGILKTVGFTDMMVLVILLAEAVLLYMMPAMMGMRLSAVGFRAISSFVGFSRMAPGIFGEGAAIALTLALLSAAWPAWNAKKLSIVDALRRR